MPENATAPLETLLLATGTLKKPQIEEAAKTASNLSISLERALTMLDMISQESLNLIKHAEELVENGTITLNLAVRAVRLAKQQDMLLEDAIGVLGSVHQQTAKVPTLTTPLTALLLECHLIKPDSLARATIQAKDAGIQTGRMLVLNRDLSSWIMSAAINALIMVREGKITKEEAAAALVTVGARKISVEQALFEQGLYAAKGEQTLKIGEIVAMAGLISEGDLLECLEIELVKEKQLGQILLEQGFITQDVLESAILLNDMIANRNIKAYQAAEVLHNVHEKHVSVYQAMAELNPPVQAPQEEITFAELLTRAGLADESAVQATLGTATKSTIKAGKQILAAGLIDELSLYLVLRTYSLYNQTLLSAFHAVNALKYCHENKIGLDEALPKLGWLLPARMQWIWG